MSIKLESAGFTGPNIDGLEVLPACTAAAHIDGQPSGCGDTPPADLGDYEGCRNCDCHECADPNNPASFPMYLAVTADRAQGQKMLSAGTLATGAFGAELSGDDARRLRKARIE